MLPVRLPVLLPPLPEQRAISTVLDSIDDAIERHRGGHRGYTEQLRDSLLHELMARGVPGWHSEMEGRARVWGRCRRTGR